MKKAMLFVVTVTTVAFVAVSGFGVEAAGSQRFGLAEFAAWPAPTPVDASFAARITAEHNVIRAKYDLPPLQWDRALADRAQEWADKLALFAKLPPDHRDDPSIGENLIWGGSGALTPQSVVARWGGEAANYDIATNTCADGKSCLHFTQVVWSTTTKVGCGKARTADGMTDFVVCDYSPPGNTGQQPPFKPTPPTIAQASSSPTSTPDQSIHWNQNVPGKIFDTESAFDNKSATPVPTPQTLSNPQSPSYDRPSNNIIAKFPSSARRPEDSLYKTPTRLPPPGIPDLAPTPTPTPVTNTVCDVCSAVQQLAAKVDQLKPTDSKTAPKNNAVPAKTTLLFPFVSNQGGFDTGISIANTSADTLGTKPSTGSCGLSYFGDKGPLGAFQDRSTSNPLQGGQSLVFKLSSGGNGVAATQGFQGYIIATCDFPYARGYAFISDIGMNKVANGYLAEILPDPRVP